MQLFKKKAYTLYYEDEIIPPPPTGCSTYSVPPGFGTIEVEGYLGYNTVQYLDCDSNPQTIVVAGNESAQDICATEIVSSTIEPTLIFEDCTIVPWDSLTANREQGYISLSGTTNGTTACGYPIPSVDGIYVATHVLNTLSIGDRVFLSDLPSITPFDGSTGIPPAYLSQYWKINLQTEVSPCTGNGTRVLIDKDGYIEELYCCPSMGE